MRNRNGQGRKAESALTTLAILSFALVGLVTKRSNVAAQPSVPGPQQASASDQGTRSPLGAGSDPGASAPPVDHPPGLIGIVRTIFNRIGRDNITLVAAGVAFYAMLAMFPALAAIVSLYALVGDPADVARRISEYGSLLPPEALKLITDGLQGFAQKSGSQLSFALGTSVLFALWSARAGISSVMTGLNIAYEETEKRSFIMQNVIALVLTLGAVVFTIVIILAVAVVPIVLKFLSLSNLTATLLDILRWPLLAVLVILGFAVIYRWAPSRSHPRWRWITWGSAIATGFWLLGSFVFSIYVSKFGSYDATYGSLGAVVILLLWFWVSALILLTGAEIDAELDARDTKAGSPMAALPRSSASRA